jgi:hypothetical protein
MRNVGLKKLGKKMYAIVAIISVWTMLETSWAGEIEPLKAALISMLGKVQVQHVGANNMDYWFKKGGKAPRVVFIEKNVYPPNCSHTWAVGIDAATGKVASVHPLEMGCPHGYPAKSKTFLMQFQGKSVADVKSLKAYNLDTIAKATGTCKLAADAVRVSLEQFQKVKGKI